jgi:hypothetical protein
VEPHHRAQQEDHGLVHGHFQGTDLVEVWLDE